LEANKADEKLNLKYANDKILTTNSVDELKLQEQIQTLSRRTSSTPSSPPLTPLRSSTSNSDLKQAKTSPKVCLQNANNNIQESPVPSPRFMTSRNTHLDTSMNEDYNITASKLERFKTLLSQPDVDIGNAYYFLLTQYR
jgi:hypothetical protein